MYKITKKTKDRFKSIAILIDNTVQILPAPDFTLSFSGVCVTRFLVLCVSSGSLIDLLYIFLLAIVVFVLRYTDSDYRIVGVMVSVLSSSVVDRGFKPRSDQTKDYEIGIRWFFDKHASLKRKRKD